MLIGYTERLYEGVLLKYVYTIQPAGDRLELGAASDVTVRSIFSLEYVRRTVRTSMLPGRG